MIKKINFQIKNNSGLEIDIDCRRIDNIKILPAVIFCHGFKGFKDWGGFPYLMERLAEAGFAAISFNFSSSGVTKENPMEFTRLDLFAENTFSKELEDLSLVTNHFFDNSKDFNINVNRVAYMGHSRGGGAAILGAHNDSRIKALVTLASVSGYARYGKETIRLWKEKGYFESENTRTKQLMRLNATLLDDIENNKEKLDIKTAASKLDIPFLIIHGKEDLSVKYTEAEELYKKANKDKTELLILPNTGHTFGVVHPYAGTTDAFETVIDSSIKFLNSNL